MRPTPLFSLASSTVCIALLSACSGGSGEVRVREGSEQIGSAPTGSVYVTSQASVVHVDENERLATLRNARSYAPGSFLETKDRDGNKTAVLKTRANREIGLRTADIVEGEPRINDLASPVSSSEAARLQKIYRDPVEE